MKSVTLFILAIFLGFASLAQDSLITQDGTILTGDIKNINRNVLKMETDFSDSDFQIDWSEVKGIYTQQTFIVDLSEGKRVNGILESDSALDGQIFIRSFDEEIAVADSEIVYMTKFEEDFWSRVNASLDFGYNYTKSNNLQQFSLRSGLGYIAKRWTLSSDLDAVRNFQDSAEAIRRTSGNVAFNYFFKNDWFVLVSANFLQNDEQKLALRSAYKTGLGNYLIRSNHAYLGVASGIAWNVEQFSLENEPDRSSAEAFLGGELNLFNTGDLSLVSSGTIYPSLTESGRFRADFKIDLKYDLPKDFYVRFGYTHNYDNQPAEGASTFDYVLQTSVGWEL